jgi:hypothetical protein
MIKWMAGIKNMYKILAEKPKRRRQLEGPHVGGGKSWRNNIQKCKLDSIHSGYSQMVDLRGHVTEPSGSIKAGNF